MTQTEAAGLACRSTAIVGNAVFAMAVSSVASATAVQTVPIAHARRPGGRPSAAGVAAVKAAVGAPWSGVSLIGRGPHHAACVTSSAAISAGMPAAACGSGLPGTSAIAGTRVSWISACT